MSQPSQPRLDVAIIGAGIAGLAAAIALKDHPGVRVQLYEKAAALREIGASIALGPNGMRTLERLGVTSALDDEVAFRNASGYPMVYRHYLTGEIVSTDPRQDHIDRRHWTARFYRAHLQEALLAEVQAARIPVHLGKAFAAATWDDGAQKLALRFGDGSTAVADIVLGADGIRSAVRTLFEPSSVPRWTGWVALRSVFARDHVAHIDSLPDEATHVWGPDGGTLFFSPLGRGLFTVVGSLQIADPDDPHAPYAAAEWADEGRVDALRALYSGWGPLARAVVAATPTTQLYPNAAAQSLASWSLGPHGRVTLAGDAAHAHGGAFAAGGSLALDDAWAFAAAVRHVFPVPDAASASASASASAAVLLPTDAQISAVIALYEKTRKTHTDRVIRVVYAGNRKKLERAKEKAAAGAAAKEEPDGQLRNRIRNREDPTWIHEHDVQAAFTSALHELRPQPDTAPALAKI